MESDIILKIITMAFASYFGWKFLKALIHLPSIFRSRLIWANVIKSSLHKSSENRISFKYLVVFDKEGIKNSSHIGGYCSPNVFKKGDRVPIILADSYSFALSFKGIGFLLLINLIYIYIIVAALFELLRAEKFMEPESYPILIPWAFILLGFAQIFRFVWCRYLACNFEFANGKVIGLKERRDMDAILIYSPLITFRDANGQIHEFLSGISRYDKSIQGKDVKVRYCPEFGEFAFEYSALNFLIPGFWILLIAASLLFLFSGVPKL